MFTLKYNEAGFRAAMRLAPIALNRNMRRAISRSLMEMARSAKEYAPKGHSLLTNSIKHDMVDDLEGTAGPHVEYGRMVEEETGAVSSSTPEEKIDGMTKRQRSILDWIKVKGIEPNDPEMSQEDLVFLFARSIAAKGTEAQPYLQPAYDDNIAKAEQRISAAIDLTLQAAAR